MKTLNILMMGRNQRLGYGYLYNWYAANDANFCPTDWQLIGDIEIGAMFGTATLLGIKEAGTTHWTTNNGTNTSGVTFIGSGQRNNSGAFDGLKSYKRYWSSQEDGANNAFSGYMTDADGAHTYNISLSKKYGLAVRLIYTGGGTPSTVTDYDGNVYDVVLYNGYRITKQNWKCTRLNNGNSIPLVTDGTTWAGLTSGARCSYSNNESYV